MILRPLRCASLIIVIACLIDLSNAYAQVLAVATVEGTYTQRVGHSWKAIPLSSTATTLPFKTTQNNVRVVQTGP